MDPSTAKSRSGWIIFYAGCPVSWASKLQSQVALSTTEAEYIAMSQALRDVIPVMNLLQEMREREFQVICNEPYVYCKVFEDNSGQMWLGKMSMPRKEKEINRLNRRKSENLLVKKCLRSFFWLWAHYVWVMNIFFKNLLDDYYSACSYLQFSYFKI